MTRFVCGLIVGSLAYPAGLFIGALLHRRSVFA